MTVLQKNQYPNGFFLVYIVNIDDAECLSPDRIPSNTNQTKELSFKIQKTVIALLLLLDSIRLETKSCRIS